MLTDTNQSPGIVSLVSKLARTTVGAIQNRFELLTVEWEEERHRLSEMLVWTVALLFLAIMAALLLTITVLLFCPEDVRPYVAAGFTLLYLIAAVVAWIVLRGILKRQPFAESVEQAKRDREWLKSLD